MCLTLQMFDIFILDLVTICLFQEMRCLTKNFKDLSQECKWAVGNYTEDVDMDPTLDRILMKSCTPMIKSFCSVSARYWHSWQQFSGLCLFWARNPQ